MSGNTHPDPEHFPVFSQTTHAFSLKWQNHTLVFFQTGRWEHCVRSGVVVVKQSHNFLIQMLWSSLDVWPQMISVNQISVQRLQSSLKCIGDGGLIDVWRLHWLVKGLGESCLWALCGFWIKSSVLARVSVKPWFVDHVVSCTIQNLMLKP